MSAINTHLKRVVVYLDGKKAFEARKPRDFNPYIRSNPEVALHWWNGWDAAKKDSIAAPPRKRNP